jgi:hypothetical protein
MIGRLDYNRDVSANAPKPPAALMERLSFLLKQTSALVERAIEPGLDRAGINGREFGVLTLIDAEGPASQQRLAGRIGVDRTTMVALIDALEENDWSTVAETQATDVPTNSRQQRPAAKPSRWPSKQSNSASNKSSPRSTPASQPPSSKHYNASPKPNRPEREPVIVDRSRRSHIARASERPVERRPRLCLGRKRWRGPARQLLSLCARSTARLWRCAPGLFACQRGL